MTADRRVTRTSISGQNMLNELDDEVASLNNRSICKMTIVGGTADAMQVTVSPPIDPSSPSLVDGMRFEIEPTSANTSSSLSIEIVDTNSPPSTVVAAKSVVDRDHAAILAGNWKATRKHLLTYDSTLNKLVVLTNIEPTPVAAVPLPSLRNILANGGCEIFQRGAGDSASIAVPASTAAAYTADRWYLTTNANQACLVSAQAGLTDRSRKCARVQRNSGQTGVGSFVFTYPLTTEECVRIRGAKVAMQFLARAGANFSPTSGTLSYGLYVGTGSEGKRGAGFTGETTPITGSVNLTPGGSAQAVTAVSASAVATNITQGEFRFSWTPTGTAGASDYVELDNCQLESGAAATDFEYLPFDYMLRECQYHYAKTFVYGTAPAQNAGLANALGGSPDLAYVATALQGLGASSTVAPTAPLGPYVTWCFPSRMRTTPTVTTFNPSAANANFRSPHGNSGSAQDVTRTINPDSTTGDTNVTIVGSGASASGIALAVGQAACYIHATADASL